jgi:hypothetical protein
MKQYLNFFLLSVLFVCCGQNPKQEQTKDNTIGTTQVSINDSIVWENYTKYTNNIKYIEATDIMPIHREFETERDTAIINDFFQNNKDSLFRWLGFGGTSDEDIWLTPTSNLYTIDINDDGEKDIIYNGGTSGEPNITIILIKQQDEYKKVFEQYQNIIEMKFIDNKLSKLVISNPGCCGDPPVVFYFYDITHNNSNPVFQLYNTIGYASWTEKPENKFSTEKIFYTVSDDAKLRMDCFLLNTEHYNNSFYDGNIIFHYKKGIKGYALAEKTANGKDWLFVRMSAIKDLKTDFLTFDEQPTEIYGWILKEDTDLK